MNALLRIALVALLLAIAAWFSVTQIRLDHRLDAFLPSPDSADQAMVVDQIGAGPGSRMLLVALTGLEQQALADASRDLAEHWRDIDGMERVENGEFESDLADFELLMQRRFLLLDGVEQRVEQDAVAEQLQERVADLAFAGSQIETLVRRDPLNMLGDLEQLLTPASAPQQIDGVWFDKEGERALLLLLTSLAPFETEAQQALLAALRQLPEPWASEAALDLQWAGTPVIAVNSAEQARADATRLSAIGSVFLLLVLLWAWRSPLAVVAGALPLAAAVIAGLLMTVLFFDSVHALTLAFGFTLLGVAMDYPVHVFGHARGQSMAAAVREVRKPLLLGVASTLIAYLGIAWSSSPGLAQLGVFSAAGLLVAAAVTLLLPKLGLTLRADAVPRDWRLPTLPIIPALAALIALLVLVAQGEQRWSGDLSRLSPMDPELLARDIDLRAALGAGDVRYLIVVAEQELEATLQSTEQVVAALRESAPGIAGWQAVSDLIPSQATQQLRRQQWPGVELMATRLSPEGGAFQRAAFEPFLDDLSNLQSLPALDAAAWQGSALGTRVDGLLAQGPWGWRSLIIPVGLENPEMLGDWLHAQQLPARLVDLKSVTESMLAAYRLEVGLSLLIAVALIVVMLLLRLRRLGLLARALGPPLAAVLCTAALFSSFDAGLTIVHLIGLLLAAGIGLDFALFTLAMARGAEERARTTRATLVCVLTSGGVFLILGQSQIGLLRMLGLTVACAVALSWLFAQLCQPRGFGERT